MVTQLSRLPWSVTYLTRRAAGASLLFAEQIGVTFFPSAPPREQAWTAGYLAGAREASDEPALTL